MEFLPPEIDDYAGQFTAAPSPLLARIERETWQQVLMPRMCSGHQQGRFLSLISQLLRPRRVLEVGTYTGYSALCLAEGLASDGRLYTVDVNAELETRVRGYFADSPWNDQLDFRVGDARTLIPQLDETWDLVFLDADKENYLAYYEMVVDRVRPGGLILADNVLWRAYNAPCGGRSARGTSAAAVQGWGDGGAEALLAGWLVSWLAR
jgi:predicted O-methyltransferase YrrM